MKRRRLIIISGIVLALVLIIFGFVQCNGSKDASKSGFQTQTITTGPLTSIIGATGTVRANQTTILTWQTSGRVSKINVSEGKRVKKGDILIELDPKSLPQSIILAQADLVNARRALDNLKNSETEKSKAAQTLANAQKAVDDAQKTRGYKDYQRADNATLDQTRANLILAQKTYADARDAYDAVSGLGDDNPTKAAALSAYATARLNRDKVQANLNWLLGKPDAVEVAQADANLAVAKAALDDAEREWERLKDGVDPQDIKAAQAKVDAIEATLSYTSLTAPIDGIVTDLPLKVGDQVSQGTTGVRIDDLSDLLIDVEVPEIDINKVKTSQDSELTFDAISNKTYTGKVTQVSKVGVTVSGVVNYVVTITMDNADENVLTGMTASVNIVVNHIENALLVPNRAVKRINGKTYIYLLKNNIPTQTEIELGAYSDTESEIASGDVIDGDMLILNPPAQMNSASGSGPNNNNSSN